MLGNGLRAVGARLAAGASVKTQLQKFHMSSFGINLKLKPSAPTPFFSMGQTGDRATHKLLNMQGPYNRSLSTGSVPIVGVDESYKKPELSKVMESRARKFCEMSNEELLPFLVKDDLDACRERLIREIMAVDNISWDQAQPIMLEISAVNKGFGSPFPGLGFLASSPYFVGVTTSITAALASIPLCFDLETTKIFNELYVTADVAEEKDLETWLEVGSWSWSWMEPVLGQVSFLLLCFAFARNQMINLGWRPYSHALRNMRSRQLQSRFPRYNGMVLHQFSVNDHWF
jgi:hypothetical protein